ncbi:dermonecrotic toxin domain-containing protein [Pseudomonas sp. zfem002]|uniref:dermonecrotic toxin domain-containing protein n=1 Tax=Pseudomonas sp. zfem002 TaxID=3078197 RepID=UPI0029279228|nr:DUF6543 domain-containing protein [Pseudomonas sp. zfem002]MDU9391983.1 NEL-type E3 ubiquitin ligase domain-containing protein [Pseudomonas sp. zfem002]
MADVQDVESSTADIHYQTVSARVPPWLVRGPAQQRQALRASVPRPMPWLVAARAAHPEVVQAWSDTWQRHQSHAQQMTAFLAQLPDVEAFAEPLLRDAIKQTFGLDLDVRRTFLFNAARARIAESHLGGNDPAVRAFLVVKATTRSLLHAALQNFETFEAEEGGLRDGRRSSSIFTSDSGQTLAPERTLDLVPERFAALCRQLDLGGRYQRLIDALFQPEPRPNESVQAAAANRQAWFKLFEQSAFRLALHLAYLQAQIDRPMYDALLDVANNGKARGDLQRCVLKLWDVELNGMVAFLDPREDAAAQRLVVYLPDEPQQPFQTFTSTQAFHAWLRDKLKDQAWRTYFLRFVAAREREPLLQRIHRALYPRVWNPGGWYEEQFDANASLHLSEQAFSEPLFNLLLRRKMALLKDDGLFHAVTTAAEDHKSTLAKIDYFVGVGLNVLNVAAFVVPGLGPVMLAVNAALLGYEVYEGFDSLAKGEREQAWNYFMDVGENLALIAALGAAGVAAQRFQGNLPLVVRSMRPLTLADGSVRLWKPDLAPFAYEVRLPADLSPGANGLYDWQGRQWLKLEGRYYSVRSLLGEAQGYRLEHPAGPGNHELTLRHNDNGGWLHELDTPAEWRGLELFRRQGPVEAEVSAPMAERAMRISGIGEAQLRQTLVDCRRPPALLSDTLQRLRLAESLGSPDAMTFDMRYRDLQPPLSMPGRLLGRHFELPNGVLEEIIGAATAQEIAEMTHSGRVPLRLAEEARLYQQQVRLARACEGLHVDLRASLDSARLLLHSLERLPQWPRTLHLALYEGTLDGRLLASIGPQQEPAVAVLWRTDLPQAFLQALYEAIPNVSRDALGIADAAALREKLQAQALPSRQQLRQWLGMPALKPAFRSPMRLADGRIGHPLSGNGQAFFTEDELLDKLRLLELEEVYAEDALQALYRSGLDRAAINARLNGLLGEMLELRACLDRWVMASTTETLSEARQLSRERIGLAVWEHWRRSILPELGLPASRLILWQVQLADLPRLPSFFGARVRGVLLSEVIQQEGESYEQVVGENQLQAFAEQFPNITSLDIRGGQWTLGLPQVVARLWPRLGALGLRELNVMIGHQDLNALSTLPTLHWLDLRGMRVRDMPATALNGLTLDYLGLDWLDLQSWPDWLDNSALGRIGELSLVGNHLSEIPADILNNTEPVTRPLRISLHGNSFSREALLNLRLAERLLQRYSFDLGLTPALEQELGERVGERRQLMAAMGSWIDPATSSTPLSLDQVDYRQRIARVLLKYWRSSVYESGSTLLILEDVDLGDLPQDLPAFFYLRVRRLELTRFTCDAAAFQRFIGQFPQLIELSLVEGRQALDSVPAWLESCAHLRELSLVRMGMSIDQAAMDALARIPMLSSLQLDGNRLGTITDVSMFGQRFLGYLGLAQMQIATWPTWLDEMLPSGIERLGLEDNLLTELPEYLLDNHRNTEGVTEITLRGNPLTRDTMVRAHTSQHYNRPYSFVMDLPDDIARMLTESHSSDSESDPGAVSPGDQELSDEDPMGTWQTGESEQDERHQHLWDTLVERGDSQSLLGLVMRLRHSADYRSAATRAELVQRVWTVLSAVQRDQDLGQILNGMAEEPLQQLHSHETCPDGIRLEFNQMELKVHTRQALSQVSDENRGPVLFGLMRGVFRAQTLDRIAREAANGRDEAEVRLAYRLRWAVQLQLPMPPRGMLYQGSANIAAGELDRALLRLRQEEQGQGLLRFAAQCDFWAAYLREVFAERFKALKDAYQAAVLRATDAHPDESSEQLATRIAALEDKFNSDEQALLERLTLEQSLSRP